MRTVLLVTGGVVMFGITAALLVVFRQSSIMLLLSTFRKTNEQTYAITHPWVHKKWHFAVLSVTSVLLGFISLWLAIYFLSAI